MTSTVLYRKWRPQLLSDVVGQEAVTRTLLNALSASSLSHAYLFCGPRGTGKTSTGRILAKAANCLTGQGKGEPCNSCDMCRAITEGRALDVIEIDAASNRGIDEIRELRERVGYAPNQARYKVYIIDEVHMLTKEASNALLKTLEEPPPHVIFVLATTEAHKLLPTILSRCQRFDFRRLSQADVVAKLSRICESEGVRAQPDILRLIARASTGSLRDAENLLQQLVTFHGKEISLKQAQSTLGITGDARARELVRHILSSDIAAGIATINSVNSDGLDLRQFNRELVQYLRALLLIKVGSRDTGDLTSDDRAGLEKIAASASLPQVLRAVKVFGQLELAQDNSSTLPMELAFVDCVLSVVNEVPSISRPVAKPVATSVPPAVKIAEKPVVPQKAPPEPVAVSTPQPAAASTTPLAAVPTTDIDRLRQAWKQIGRVVPDDLRQSTSPGVLRSARALLESARPKSVEGEIIVVSFRSSLLHDKMQKPENQKIAERILGSFLGRTCRVQSVYEPEDNHMMQSAVKSGAEILEVEEL